MAPTHSNVSPGHSCGGADHCRDENDASGCDSGGLRSGDPRCGRKSGAGGDREAGGIDGSDGFDLAFNGHLQSNKALKALETFNWIQSVDNLKLAQRLDRLVQENPHLAPIHVCLQVRLRPDPTKSGWEQQELLASLPELDRLTHIHICGLMVIPPFGLPESETAAIFQEAQNLATQIRAQSWQNLQISQLSMGMSDDYPLAIQAGATMIRPGRSLFGDRHPTAISPI
jgi:pyridoxal phosphate enzyme (YggS family)